MSLRRRIPFSFSTQEVEDGQILDEQEQDEVIQRLKDRSTKQDSRSKHLLQAVVGLSLLLHILYICETPPRYSPFESIFPSESYVPSLPLSFTFALLHILVHLMSVVRLLPAPNPIRAAVASSFSPLLSYRVVFGVSSVAPVLCLLCRGDWRDIAWWAVPDAMTLFIWTTEKWAAEEAESIQQLESLRYVARGA